MAVAAESNEPEVTALPNATRGRGMTRVLVLDGDCHYREALARFLGGIPELEVQVAGSADEARKPPRGCSGGADSSTEVEGLRWALKAKASGQAVKNHVGRLLAWLAPFSALPATPTTARAASTTSS